MIPTSTAIFGSCRWTAPNRRSTCRAVPTPTAGRVWSPDGKLLAFTGRRGEKEYDIHYVWLRAEDDERTAHERTLDKALEKIHKARPGSQEPKKDGDKPAGKPSSPPAVAIDFDGIFDRIHRVSNPNVTEDDLMWSPDSKKLAFVGMANNQRGLYSIEIPENLAPQSMTTAPGNLMRWLKNGQIVGLSGGVPAVITGGTGGGGSGGGGFGGGRFGGPRGTPPATPPSTETPAASTTSGYRFQARQEVDLPKKYAAAFDSAWRTMRDNWYDEKLGNRDWNAVRAQVPRHGLALRGLRDAQHGHQPDARRTERLAPRLHRLSGGGRGRGGPTPPTTPAGEPEQGWHDVTRHLGVRFDENYAGPGLKVRDVLPGGPAEHRKSRIEPGEMILAIDGKEVNPKMDLTEVLNGPANREMVLKVRNAAGEGARGDVAADQLSAKSATCCCDKWLADNRTMVEKLSNGKLGYLHIRRNGHGELLQVPGRPVRGRLRQGRPGDRRARERRRLDGGPCC